MLLISCKKETPVKPIPTPTSTIFEQSHKPKTECYFYNENGTLIDLRVNINGDVVIGSLRYILKEKDGNDGMFVGKLKDNIFIADYSYISEGTESVRQIAFQFKGDELVEGYGEMSEDGTRFKDVSKIKFTSTMPLSKGNCPE